MKPNPLEAERQARLDLKEVLERRPTTIIGRILRKAEVAYREARVIRTCRDIKLQNAGSETVMLPTGDMFESQPVYINHGTQEHKHG
mgnify:FL=1